MKIGSTAFNGRILAHTEKGGGIALFLLGYHVVILRLVEPFGRDAALLLRRGPARTPVRSFATVLLTLPSLDHGELEA